VVDSLPAALSALTSLDPAQRRAAANYLGEHPSRAACEVLIAALGDPNPAAHEAIIRALTRQTDVELIHLLVQVVREENPTRRNAAQTALLEACRLNSAAPVIALNHPMAEVRQWAAEALGELNEAHALPALVERLNDAAEFPNVRRAAAQALGKIGDPSVTLDLLSAAAHGDFWMRQAAVEAVSRLGDERAVAPLLDVMRQDAWTRPIVIKALGAIGSAEAVPELVRCLLDDGSEAVRAAALEALLRIVLEPAGRRTGTPKTAKLRPMIPAAPLQRELNARTMPNSAYAAHLLGWLGQTEALPDLLEALQGTEDGIRDAAVEAILRFGPHAVPMLIAALTRPEAAIRERAAELLGLLGDRGAVAPLAQQLKDESLAVRQTVLRALSALGGETAYTGLLHAIVEPSTREAALHLITEMSNDALINELKPYLQRHLYEGNRDPALRWASARALSLLGDEAAVSILLNATRLPDDSVRRPAAEALAWVRGRRAVNVLIEALGDRDWLVRQKAVEALSSIQDSRAVAALAPLASDPEWRVRLAVVAALSHMRDARIYGALLKLAQDTDRWVRRAAIEMCAPLDDPRATEIVLRGLKDSDANIRLAALAALRWRRDPALALPIAELLGDPQPHVRQAVLHTLARATGTAGIDHIILMASDPVETVRLEVAYVLGELGSEEALPALETLLRDQERAVRRQALESLAHIGTLAAIEALAEALTNPDIKADAQEQLRALGEPALRLLLSTARSSAPELRAASAETLGQLGYAHALPTLRQLLRDADVRVRQAAEAAMRAIKA
jgi:HEAT repeat protein